MDLSSPRRIKEIQDYQKIAAGEVIERPASVVKELLENSIDAGATKITINVKNFGKSEIHVIDDGSGIHPEDVELAFKPHNSSKIRSATELNSLHSLGFRGEALFSIGAISKVELITKTHTDSLGVKIELDGGVVKSVQKIAANPGTSIKVRDLFYNTPVRYKFLKSDRVELGHITDIVSRYVIGYPTINIRLLHDGKSIFSSPSSTDYRNAIFDVFGKEYAKNSYPFSFKHSLFEIRGYLGDPKLAQATSHSSTVFINQRYVISTTVQEAMQEGYKDYIMIHKYPFYVVFLSVDPSKVDFNIHPTKKVVRFEEEEEILVALREGIRSTVTALFGQSSTSAQLDQSVTASGKTIEEYIQEKTKSLEKIDSSYESHDIASFSSHEMTNIQLKSQKISSKKTKPIRLESVVPTLIPPKPKFSHRDDWIRSSTFPKLRLIPESGQLNNVYFVFEGEDGFYILDMHAADERINFEREQKAYQSGGMTKQRLIAPLTIEIPINKRDFLLGTLVEIGKFGFEIEHLGGTTFAVRTIPAILRTVEESSILADMCLEIIQMGKESSFSQSVDKIIKYIACHESIRAGEQVTDPALPKRLLIELSECDNPHHCAHGRPTMLYFSWNYLEKEFHR